MSKYFLRSDQFSPDSAPSSSSCLARKMGRRRLRHSAGVVHHHPQAWSMSSSLITANLPESPPMCVYPPPSTTTYFDDNATHFSTTTNQRFGIGCIDHTNDRNNNNHGSNCFTDIDEWLEHANKFCKSFNHHTRKETVHSSPEEDDLRISAVCNNNLHRAPENELYNIVLPSVREECPPLHHHAQTRLNSCINTRSYGGPPYKSRNNDRTRLMMMARNKPYDQLFNHVTRQKMEDGRDARNKAKHIELMHRLKRKEEAINDWERQKTRKAMDNMDKIQNELERKQLVASARTQKKICTVREKAEKQKLNLRRSTMKKFQQLQISETHSASDTTWDSRLALC